MRNWRAAVKLHSVHPVIYWKKKRSHFAQKSWVRVIGEYLSQFDSNFLQLLGIPGRIFGQTVAQLFRSNNFIFSYSVANNSLLLTETDITLLVK